MLGIVTFGSRLEAFDDRMLAAENQLKPRSQRAATLAGNDREGGGGSNVSVCESGSQERDSGSEMQNRRRRESEPEREHTCLAWGKFRRGGVLPSSGPAQNRETGRERNSVGPKDQCAAARGPGGGCPLSLSIL